MKRKPKKAPHAALIAAIRAEFKDAVREVKREYEIWRKLSNDGYQMADTSRTQIYDHNFQITRLTNQASEAERKLDTFIASVNKKKAMKK